jgi:hypothetical protein
MRFRLNLAPVLAVLGAVLSILPAPARAYSPTDPKVQAIVAKARQFLQGATGESMGEAASIALALIKSGSDDSDPKVQQAVAAIRQGLQEKKLGVPINYHVAISIIFLIENDPVKYRPEIQQLLDVLLDRQEQHGGWSYWPGEGTYGRDTGDASMTQFGTLALWEAKVSKFVVPREKALALVDFWMRTQTPQGAWSYQAKLAPPGQRINQELVRDSISIGGLGSTYVIGELFGMGGRKEEKEQSSISSALQKVRERDDLARYYTPEGLDVGNFRETLRLGDDYITETHKGYEGVGGNYRWLTVFYMYSMERYRSFEELYKGKASSSPWYDQGVEFLEKTQESSGGWNFGKAEHIETPLAVLFLTRSTKKSIEREFGLGLVRGGRGLPADISQIAIDEKTGNIINPEAAGTVTELMAILANPENSKFDAIAADPSKLVEPLLRPATDEDKVAREQHLQRLKDMVSKGTYEQRLIAVKALARTGDMNQVPLLLYALTDPDPRVVEAADQGLRFISRKIEGFGPPGEAKSEELEKVRQQWRAWLLSVRPDAELLD